MTFEKLGNRVASFIGYNNFYLDRLYFNQQPANEKESKKNFRSETIWNFKATKL